MFLTGGRQPLRFLYVCARVCSFVFCRWLCGKKNRPKKLIGIESMRVSEDSLLTAVFPLTPLTASGISLCAGVSPYVLHSGLSLSVSVVQVEIEIAQIA